MSLKTNLASAFIGASLVDAFNVVTNPLTPSGLAQGLQTVIQEPSMLIAGTIMRPDALVPLAAAAVVGVVMLASRKSKPAPGPQ